MVLHDLGRGSEHQEFQVAAVVNLVEVQHEQEVAADRHASVE